MFRGRNKLFKSSLRGPFIVEYRIKRLTASHSIIPHVDRSYPISIISNLKKSRATMSNKANVNADFLTHKETLSMFLTKGFSHGFHLLSIHYLCQPLLRHEDCEVLSGCDDGLFSLSVAVYWVVGYCWWKLICFGLWWFKVGVVRVADVLFCWVGVVWWVDVVWCWRV